MPRYALEVAYDGTDFQGSQGQTRPGVRTVDGTLKTGLESLLGQRPKLLWASRTDSGVHAEGNVCAFDALLPFPAERLRPILNPLLPADLRVTRQLSVTQDFHPRFDALSRSYRYRICSGECPSPVAWRYSWEIQDSLELAALRSAAELFRGRHSFAAFCNAASGTESADCDLQELEIAADVFCSPCAEPFNRPDLTIGLTANRFLRHMVCRIVGAIVAVGQGRLSLDDLDAALNEQKRIRFKPAPARGLTLVRVTYPGTLGYDSHAAPAGRRQEK